MRILASKPYPQLIPAQVQFSEEVNISQMRNLLIPKLGSEISVTYFGNKANNNSWYLSQVKEKKILKAMLVV